MTLFITEPELYDLLRLDKVNGPAIVRALEMTSIRVPFPKPKPPFKLRYRAAVMQWLDDFHKVRLADGTAPVVDGEENHAPRFQAAKAHQAARPRNPGAGVAPAAGVGHRDHVVGRVVGRERPRLHAKDSKVVARIGPDGRRPDR